MKDIDMTSTQKTSLILMRILIGWHFLYEGIIKLYNPSWTAKGYLASAEFLRPFFTWIAQDSLIPIVNTLNIVGLIAVGICLLIGLKVKWGSIAGMVLLSFYYLAHPPFSSMNQGPSEGSYWIVNKNLIEIASLFVIYIFPTSTSFGLERLFTRKTTPAINP
jgi:thiosulfate dehydrogenase (quinone) large subunit